MASRATKSGLAAESQRKVSDFFILFSCVFSIVFNRDEYGS